MRSAALLQALEKARRRYDDAAIGLDGLDEDGSDLVRPKLALEAPVEVIEGAGDQIGRELRAVGIGIGQPGEAGTRRCMGLRAVARHRNRGGAAAVIGPDEGEDAATAGRRGFQQAHHGVVGVGAGVAEPDPSLAIVREMRQQVLSKAHSMPDDARGEAYRPHVAHGLADRFGHCRVAVAEARRAPRGAEVEHAPAALLDHVGARAPHGGRREEANPLDIGDGTPVAGHQVLGHGSILALRLTCSLRFAFQIGGRMCRHGLAAS